MSPTPESGELPPSRFLDTLSQKDNGVNGAADLDATSPTPESIDALSMFFDTFDQKDPGMKDAGFSTGSGAAGGSMFLDTFDQKDPGVNEAVGFSVTSTGAVGASMFFETLDQKDPGVKVVEDCSAGLTGATGASIFFCTLSQNDKGLKLPDGAGVSSAAAELLVSMLFSTFSQKVFCSSCLASSTLVLVPIGVASWFKFC